MPRASQLDTEALSRSLPLDLDLKIPFGRIQTNTFILRMGKLKSRVPFKFTLGVKGRPEAGN